MRTMLMMCLISIVAAGCSRQEKLPGLERETVSDHGYPWTGPYTEGLARVSTGPIIEWDDKEAVGGKWGYVDAEGKVIIQPSFADARDFSEGLAAVNIGGHATDGGDYGMPHIAGGKWGYIDHSGKCVIPAIYGAAQDFHGGLACVEETGKWGAIDRNGRFVIQPRFQDSFIFREGLAKVKLAAPPYPYGFIDTNGAFVIKPDLEYAGDFHEGLAWFRDRKGKYGFLDTSGRVCIPPKYDEAKDFSEGLACVSVDGAFHESFKCGYIDRNDHMVIAPTFHLAQSFQGGKAQVALITGYKVRTNRMSTMYTDKASGKDFLDEIDETIFDPKYDMVFIDGKGEYLDAHLRSGSGPPPIPPKPQTTKTLIQRKVWDKASGTWVKKKP